MTKHEIVLIWAQDLKGVIGSLGSIPWQIKQDMQHFKALTQGHTVIMGRKTWESLPPQFRPLPNRKNIVISTTGKPEDFPRAQHATSVIGAAELLSPMDKCVYVIGGGDIYQAFMPLANRIERTLIHNDYMGDTYAPVIKDSDWQLVKNEPQIQDGNLRFDFQTFERKPGERRRMEGGMDVSNFQQSYAVPINAPTPLPTSGKPSAHQQKLMAISRELLGPVDLLFGASSTHNRMAMYPKTRTDVMPRLREKDGKYEIDSYAIVATEDDYKR